MRAVAKEQPGPAPDSGDARVKHRRERGGAGPVIEEPGSVGPQHKNHAAYFVPGLKRGLNVLEVLAAAER
ncbi:MAG: hypothetical protein ACREDL_21710, partial [Bradyrhizobium sp.]